MSEFKNSYQILEITRNICVVEDHLYESKEKITRIFRAPTVHDGSGTHKRLPHEIKWNEIKIGDLLFVIGIDDRKECNPPIVHTFQFWHVISGTADDHFMVDINNMCGMAADGEYVYDKMAQMMALPPCKPS